MTEEVEPPEVKQGATGKSPKSGTSGDWMDRLSRSAAILGAFIAVGETASKMVESHFQQQIEESKARAEITINKEKSESTLASDFLKIILDKDTKDKDRSMVLDALSALPNHPLQQWASARHVAIEAALTAYEKLDVERLKALQDQGPGSMGDLRAQQDQLTIEIEQNKDDPAKVTELRSRRMIVADQIARVIRAQATHPTSTASLSVKETTTVTTSVQIPIDEIKRAVSAQAGSETKRARAMENIDKYLPALGTALADCGFVDPFTVAQILAEIAHETDSFSSVVEYASGQGYEGRADLGNTQPGDGPRFKSRGLIGFPTGRASYADLGEQLGFGARLINSPEDVLIPDIAAQAVCFYFKRRGKAFVDAARADDVASVRRMVNGGLNGLESVRSYYRLFLPILQQRNENSPK
ncbi:MAG: hypothetical protein JO227_01435 [Acetobacteraceae bacterium]|nr:hypothetical protein [Acetobacteraceae bacterium]